MRLGYLVAAHGAVIDRATNNVSIFNIIEQITAPTFPIAIPISIVAQLVKQKSKDTEELRIVLKLDSRKQPIGEQKFTVGFQGQQRTRIIMQLQPLVIEVPGLLEISLFHKSAFLGSWEIDVIQLQQQAAVTTSPGQAGGGRATPRRSRRKR
jgi:Family of unknown function (DUF6941)